MNLSEPKAKVWVPDDVSEVIGLERASHMGISAHTG